MANATGRPITPLVISPEERAYLERQVQHHREARSMSERCRVILRCADGVPNKTVAIELGMHEHTVGKWRRRFLKERLEGLLDEARPGRPRIIDDDQVAAIIERTIGSKPKDTTHWSIRSMATQTGFSHTTIRRIWNAFGLQPHLTESFKLSSDPLSVDKVRDIVGLYLSPPTRALVLSVDEMRQMQVLDQKQSVLPMMPGVPERRNYSYVRRGTKSFIAALDIASGFVIGKCHKRNHASEFLDFLETIDLRVPEGLDIHIIMDNYATYTTVRVKNWLARRPHYHVHLTSTSSHWINQVEHWFAELTLQQIQRGVHTSTKQLKRDIFVFLERHYEDPNPYRWIKSADENLTSIKHFRHETGIKFMKRI